MFYWKNVSTQLMKHKINEKMLYVSLKTYLGYNRTVTSELLQRRMVKNVQTYTSGMQTNTSQWSVGSITTPRIYLQ